MKLLVIMRCNRCHAQLSRSYCPGSSLQYSGLYHLERTWACRVVLSLFPADCKVGTGVSLGIHICFSTIFYMLAGGRFYESPRIQNLLPSSALRLVKVFSCGLNNRLIS